MKIRSLGTAAQRERQQEGFQKELARILPWAVSLTMNPTQSKQKRNGPTHPAYPLYLAFPWRDPSWYHSLHRSSTSFLWLVTLQEANIRTHTSLSLWLRLNHLRHFYVFRNITESAFSFLCFLLYIIPFLPLSAVPVIVAQRIHRSASDLSPCSIA